MSYTVLVFACQKLYFKDKEMKITYGKCPRSHRDRPRPKQWVTACTEWGSHSSRAPEQMTRRLPGHGSDSSRTEVLRNATLFTYCITFSFILYKFIYSYFGLCVLLVFTLFTTTIKITVFWGVSLCTTAAGYILKQYYAHCVFILCATINALQWRLRHHYY